MVIRFSFVIYFEKRYFCTAKNGVLKKVMNIHDLRAGNKKAFEQLFVEWYDPLCRYAYGLLPDTDDAEDIVQKMFCKLWDQRSNLEIHTSVKSYLYRIVHNDCLNKIKQRKIRMEHHEYLAYTGQNTVNNTDTRVISGELNRQIETAIENLPPRCREVFRLSRYEYLSYAEIARKLNITHNTVETQIVKALKILRKELKEYLPVLILLLTVINIGK